MATSPRSDLLRPALGLLLLTLALGACGDGDEDTASGFQVLPAKHEIVAPGEGEPNAAPLLPLRPGLTFWDRYGEVSAQVKGPMRLGNQTVLTVAGPLQEDWWSVTGEGVFYHGNSHTGPKPRPVLMVPATVRVGMKWQSYHDGDEPAVVGEVLSVEPMDTMWGKRLVWHVRRTDPRFETSTDSWYAEGFGGVGEEGHAITATAAVLPLDDTSETAPSRLELSPLAGGEPILRELQGMHLSALHDGTTPGLSMRLDVRHADHRPGSAFADIVWGTVCLQYAEGGLSVMPGQESTDWETVACPDASGVAFDGGGGMVSRSLKYRGGATMWGVGADYHNLFASAARLDGEVRFFGAASDPLLGSEHHVRWGWWVPTEEPWIISWEWRTGDVFGPVKHDNPSLVGDDQYIDALGLPMEVSRRGFGMLLRERNELSFARYDGYTIRDAGPGMVLAGDLSVIASPEERRYFATGFAGRVEEVIAEPEGMLVRHIGDLGLPAGHALVGAVVHDGTLFALSMAGQEPDPGSIDPQMGDVYGWTAALGELAAPEPPTSIGAVRVFRVGADLEVCWPRGLGAPILDGWTLAGEPAVAVPSRLDGSCVLLLRPHDSAVDLDTNGSHWAEGEIPGWGRVAAAVTGPEDYEAFARETFPSVEDGTILAGTGDGEVVSPRLLYDPAGLVVGAPPHAEGTPWGFTTPMRPDLAGGGVWHITNQYPDRCPDDPLDRCTAFIKTGWPDGPRAVPRNSDINECVVGSVWGGGIFVKWHEEATHGTPSGWRWAHLKPDASWVELDSNSDSWETMLPDGRGCRTKRRGGIHCGTPDGPDEVVIELPEGSQPGSRWLPVSETVLYWLPLSGDQTTGTSWLRVDVDSGTATVVDRSVLPPEHRDDSMPRTQLFYDGKGRLYGLADLRSSPQQSVGWTILRFDPEGLVDLGTPDTGTLFVQGEVPELLAVTDRFVILDGSRRGVVRVPRPDAW